MTPGPRLHGRVVAFDAHVGLGEVLGDDGQRYMFHCAEIADGSRLIDVGQAVGFDTMVKFGRTEAAALTPG